ncbi:hypothetical protein [Helicobacter sp. T3_23-1056]
MTTNIHPFAESRLSCPPSRSTRGIKGWVLSYLGVGYFYVLSYLRG